MCAVALNPVGKDGHNWIQYCKFSFEPKMYFQGAIPIQLFLYNPLDQAVQVMGLSLVVHHNNHTIGSISKDLSLVDMLTVPAYATSASPEGLLNIEYTGTDLWDWLHMVQSLVGFRNLDLTFDGSFLIKIGPDDPQAVKYQQIVQGGFWTPNQ